MKNKKGFTLIELLLTIALLAVISIISFVSINAIINKNKDNECNSLVNNIKMAAKEYLSDNRYNSNFTIENNKVVITAADLISQNYLNGDIVNPYDKDVEIDPSAIKVIIEMYVDRTVKEVKITESDGTTEAFNGCQLSSNGGVLSGIRITRKVNKSYQINYLLNGGKPGNKAPNTASYESTIEISNPTKTVNITFNDNPNASANTEGAIFSSSATTVSQNFDGWTTNTNMGLSSGALTGTTNNPTTSWTGSKTQNTYFKQLRSNNGTVTLVANWNLVQLALPTVTKEHHDCGWNTSKTSATIEYPSGGTYTIASNAKSNINLYAFCDAAHYLVTADATNGSISTTEGWEGTGASATKSITYGTNYGTLPVPTRKGFTFEGWYTTPSGGTKIESTTQMTSTNDHTVYAHWNGVELSFNNQTLSSGTYGVNYTSNAFTGATNGTDNYTYTIKSGAPEGATINSSNRTISFTNSTQAGTYNVIITVTDNVSGKTKDATMTITITKAQCTAPTNLAISTTGIITWNASPNALSYEISLDNTNYSPVVSGVNYESTITSTTGNRTIYVRSICNSTNYNTPSTAVSTSVSVYKVTLTKGKGINTISGEGNYIKNATVNINATTISGYVWDKWTNEGNIVSTIKAYSAQITSDWAYTANATGNTYTIAYELNGGYAQIGTPSTGTYDEDVYIPNPSKTITITGKANGTGATVGTKTSGSQTFIGWTSNDLGNNAKTGTASNNITTSWTGGNTQNNYFKNLTESNSVTMIASWEPVGIALPTLASYSGLCKWYSASSGGVELGEGGAIYIPSANSYTAITVYARCEPSLDLGPQHNSDALFGNTTIKRNQIKSITFANSINGHTVDNTTCWDVGSIKDGTILAWTTGADADGLYDITIGSEGGVLARSSYSLFENLTNMTTINNTNNLNTKYITAMDNMFRSCGKLTSLDANSWDTSNVTDMKEMFLYATRLNNVNISNWNTAKVTNMMAMFERTTALTNLNISNWDTRSVLNMSYMFDGSGINTLNISDWDTGNVTGMRNMFARTSNLTTLDASNWDTRNVKYMTEMFNGAISLSDAKIGNWDTSNVIDMMRMFENARSLQTLNINNWNVSSVTNMQNMFDNARGLQTLNLNNWDVSSVIYMGSMFSSTHSLKNLKISNWNTSNVAGIMSMFYNANNLTELDIGNWNVSNVKGMSETFRSTHNLTHLNISNWNTSSVTSMQNLFNNASNLTELEIGNWDVSNVKSISGTFSGTKKLTHLNINNWNTSSVTNMQNLFYNTGLITLDISNWDTRNVGAMDNMFLSSYNLTTVYVGNNWNTDNVTNSTNMFLNARSIVGGAGTTYNSSYIDKTYAKIDGGTSSPGYFTAIPGSGGGINAAQPSSIFSSIVNVSSPYNTINECNNNCGTSCLTGTNGYVCPTYNCNSGVLSGTNCYEY